MVCIEKHVQWVFGASDVNDFLAKSAGTTKGYAPSMAAALRSE
jgi:hypothetical protein